MRRELPDPTLQATELVNAAYWRVFQGKPFSWENRTHFFRVIAQKMRHILPEHARRRGEERHGGQWIKVHVTDMATIEDQRSQFLALNDALEELARLNPRLAQVVELHKLVGLTHQETAAILDLSEKTVRNDWVFARAWLKQRVPDPRRRET